MVMAMNKTLLITLMTILAILLGLYMSSISNNGIMVEANENSEVTDCLWIGGALFINYLLLVCYFAPETSPLLKSNSRI